MNEAYRKRQFRSRLKLILVFALFFGPLFVAVVWYHGLGAVYAPRSSVNHAPLITPPAALADFRNLRLDGSLLEMDGLRGYWTVVHRLERACGSDCEVSLYNTRQTRLALGKDATRVRRILLGDDQGLMTAAVQAHPDMEIVLRGEGGLEEQVIPVASEMNAGPDDALLIDPLGNVMMLIPVTINPSDLLKDLKKLMKLSQVG